MVLFLRLTEKRDLIEIVWSPPNSEREFIHSVSKERLKEFRNSWKALVRRISNISIPDKKKLKLELQEELHKKSIWLGELMLWRPTGKERKLAIIADPGLSEIPLEILPYSNGYLVDYIEITRNVRIHFRSLPKRVNDNFLLVSHTESKLEIQESIEEEERVLIPIVSKLGKLSKLKGSSIRPSRLQEELLVSKYFQYCGHLEPGYIPFLNDSPFFSEEIARMNLSQLDIVFLNGCSGFQSSASRKSLAEGFLSAGVETVIGFSEPIQTLEAEKTSLIFWRTYSKSKDKVKSFQECLTVWKKENSWNRFFFLRMGGEENISKTSNSKKIKIILVAAIFLPVLSIAIFSKFKNSNQDSKKSIPETLIEKESIIESNVKISKKEKFFQKKVSSNILSSKKQEKNPLASSELSMTEPKLQNLIENKNSTIIEKVVNSNPTILLSSTDNRHSKSWNISVNRLIEDDLKIRISNFLLEDTSLEEKIRREKKTLEILEKYQDERIIKIELMKSFGSAF